MSTEPDDIEEPGPEDLGPEDLNLDDLGPEEADPEEADPEEAGPEEQGERIAKRLARAGLCSRRDAERWIAEGRVAVGGEVLTSPAVVVHAGDLITVDGKLLPEEEPTRLWRYHKPAGLVTTARDEKGRTTVFEKMPADMPRVISIGRLDLNTEGLLLLTNDGELARHLELPSTGWPRRYRVRVHGVVDPAKLTALARGVTVEGVKYGPIEAILDREQGSNAWLTVSLREGKNREVRKVLETLGLSVTRLIRVAYGPFQLGKLPRGEVEEVPRRVLRDQLGTLIKRPGRPEADQPASPSATAFPTTSWRRPPPPEPEPLPPTRGGRVRISLQAPPKAAQKATQRAGRARRAAALAEAVYTDKPRQPTKTESGRTDKPRYPTKTESEYAGKPRYPAKSESEYGAKPRYSAKAESEYGAKPRYPAKAEPERTSKPGYPTKAESGYADKPRYPAKSESGHAGKPRYPAKAESGHADKPRYPAKSESERAGKPRYPAKAESGHADKPRHAPPSAAKGGTRDRPDSRKPASPSTDTRSHHENRRRKPSRPAS